MTPRAKRSLETFRRQLRGRAVVRRGSGASGVSIDVRAELTGFTPEELVGGIDQGTRKVVILAEDVTFDGGLKSGDRVIWRGKPLQIHAIDDARGDVDGTLVAYYVQVKGD